MSGKMNIRNFIQSITGSYPKDINYYNEALRHKTVAGNSNERLECLGDAVLGLVSCEYLFKTYPDANEGIISRLRMKIVCGSALLEYAKSINLQNFIVHDLVTPCEKIVEDAFEALLGAIYLDMGYEMVYTVVSLMFADHFPAKRLWADNNYKDSLNKLQKRLGVKVRYDKQYTDENDNIIVKVFVGNIVALGRGKTLKLAEQNASYVALTDLGVKTFILGQDPDIQYNEVMESRNLITNNHRIL